MNHTHYADTSGFNPASQSTPSDLLRVAQPDMENPTFAAIVRMPSITLPVAGTISSYTPLLGLDGVIGVKSGFTSVAGGCDVVAVVRQVHGEPVMILGAVTGQEGPNVLDLAAFDALILANAMSHDIGSSQLVAPGAIVAHVTAAGHTVGATVQGSVTALTWPGVRVSRLLVTTRPITSNTRAGTRIGSLEVVLGQQQFVLPVGLARRLPKESLTQRVF
jgi:D-alanyl-D-alanine carboxypeptidase (penicillin-binding protein 5/6)